MDKWFREPAEEELIVRPPTPEELFVLRKQRVREPTTQEQPEDPLHRVLAGRASPAECRTVVRLLLRRSAQSNPIEE